MGQPGNVYFVAEAKIRQRVAKNGRRSGCQNLVEFKFGICPGEGDRPGSRRRIDAEFERARLQRGAAGKGVRPGQLDRPGAVDDQASGCRPVADRTAKKRTLADVGESVST